MKQEREQIERLIVENQKRDQDSETVQVPLSASAIANAARVFFPAQISAAVADIIVMVAESPIKSADGFRIVSKSSVSKRLDPIWSLTSKREKERLTKKAMNCVVALQLVAQDHEHIWEVRA